MKNLLIYLEALPFQGPVKLSPGYHELKYFGMAEWDENTMFVRTEFGNEVLYLLKSKLGS